MVHSSQGTQPQAKPSAALQKDLGNCVLRHTQRAGAMLYACTPAVPGMDLSLGCWLGGALQVVCGWSKAVPTA